MKKGGKLGVSEVAAMKKKKSELRAMNGLKKKFFELLTLCEIEGFLIISDSDGNQVMTMGEDPIQQQSETWPEDKDQCMKIISRYKENSGFKKSYSGLGKKNDSKRDEEENGFKNSSSLDESLPEDSCVVVDCYSPDSVLGMNSTGNSHRIDIVMDSTLNQVSPLIEVEQQQYNFYNSDECFNGCGGGDESCNNTTCWDQLNDLNELDSDGQQRQTVIDFGNSRCFNGGGDDESFNDISWDQLTSLVEVNDEQCFSSLENSECFLLSDGSDGAYQNPIIDDADSMFQTMMYGYSLGYSDGESGNNVFSSTSEETYQYMLSDSSLNPQLMN